MFFRFSTWLKHKNNLIFDDENMIVLKREFITNYKILLKILRFSNYRFSTTKAYKQKKNIANNISQIILFTINLFTSLTYSPILDLLFYYIIFLFSPCKNKLSSPTIINDKFLFKPKHQIFFIINRWDKADNLSYFNLHFTTPAPPSHPCSTTATMDDDTTNVVVVVMDGERLFS